MALNRFMGIGNLTRDVEVREVGQNKVARFAIAMNEKYRKQDGTMAETTEFMEVEYWGNSGVFQYLTKGQMVYVEGSIRTEKWTGNDGVERSTTKLRAREIQLLGSRQQQPQQTSAQQQAPAPQQYQRPDPPRPQTPRPPVPQPQRPPMPHAPQQYQQPAPQPSPNPYQNFSQPSASGYGQQVSYGDAYQEDLPL